MESNLLQRVVNAPGISGHEDAAQGVVADVLRGCCEEVKTDRLGNVIGRKKGKGPKVVLAAHVDEIGMMVKHVGDDGFIRFQRVGGLFYQCLTSQLVVIHGRKQVRGVIAPDLTLKEGDKLPPVDELLIDTGLPREELMALIEIGDPITLAQELLQLNDKVVVGRNFDDRIGTFCMLEAMRRVGTCQCDVYAVSTVQEEVGVRGMPVAAYAIEPDLGLAIDGSLCRAANTKPHQYTCEMGKGVGIYLIDNLTIGDRRLVRFLYELCQKNGIAFQRNIGGGTDASALQRSKTGALVTTVGAPVRYMHSTVQMCHADDIEATVELLRLFVEHAHELGEAQ
jgi:putative aminopeptidase FrvX